MTQLTPEQISFYNSQGYLVLDNISDSIEIERLRKAYDRIFSTHIITELAGAGSQALKQIHEPVQYSPDFKNCLFRQNGRAIAQQLLGKDFIAQGEHAILKPANGGLAMPWHQDEAWWDPAYDYNAFSLWMPLQDVNEVSGCLYVIPESHTKGILKHHKPNLSDHALEVTYHDKQRLYLSNKQVHCPLKAGGCIIYHNRTLHYSPANNSTESRRAYILVYGVPPRLKS